jgi:hypothetical protein
MSQTPRLKGNFQPIGKIVTAGTSEHNAPG